MESVGEEKKIQALFSEARLADEQTTPSFVGVWNRAQAKTIRTRIAFSLSFVAATALLVCALVSLAWWSTHWQRNPDAIAIAPPAPAVTAPGAVVVPANVSGDNQETNSSTPGVKRVVVNSKSPAMKVAARREASLLAANRLVKADRKAAHELKAIASWQSPTATLLDSPSDDLLKSLPQLNHTVDDLKTILPSQPR